MIPCSVNYEFKFTGEGPHRFVSADGYPLFHIDWDDDFQAWLTTPVDTVIINLSLGDLLALATYVNGLGIYCEKPL